MAALFGLLYKIHPLSFTAIKLINILFSLATAVAVAAIAKRLAPGNSPAGVIAALMWAVYPFFIFYTGLVLSETVFLAFLAAGFFFFLDRRLMSRPSCSSAWPNSPDPQLSISSFRP